MTPKDHAVDALIRFVLSHWIVALVAIGLTSAPLHAAARMPDADSGGSIQAAEAMQALHGIHGQLDHHHGTLPQSHALGQSCCHPGCILAVVGTFADTLHALPLSKVVPIPADLTRVPTIAYGIDRPPKHP
jgi:hypothetical protein